MEEKNKLLLPAVGFIAILAIAAAIYFLFIRAPKTEKPTAAEIVEEKIQPAETEKVSEKSAETPGQIEVDLDKSDDLVRDLVKNLSSHPELARWLLTESVIRKFTAAVDNIANGVSPRKHIDFFSPKSKFLVLERNGVFYVDSDSYKRYSQIAVVFGSLDSKNCVRLYQQLIPAIQEAYRDLGYPEGNFDQTLIRAIDELLAVPVVEEEIVLESKLLSYEMVDPKFERLSQAQKHFFRMGPRNIRKIKAKLTELKILLPVN